MGKQTKKAKATWQYGNTQEGYSKINVTKNLTQGNNKWMQNREETLMQKKDFLKNNERVIEPN